MYEETVSFFEHLFRDDGSILDILAANHTYLNESFAKHYGIAGVEGASWRRVDGIREHGRGGVLAMATVRPVNPCITNQSHSPRQLGV